MAKTSEERMEHDISHSLIVNPEYPSLSFKLRTIFGKPYDPKSRTSICSVQSETSINSELDKVLNFEPTAYHFEFSEICGDIKFLSSFMTVFTATNLLPTCISGLEGHISTDDWCLIKQNLERNAFCSFQTLVNSSITINTLFVSGGIYSEVFLPTPQQANPYPGLCMSLAVMGDMFSCSLLGWRYLEMRSASEEIKMVFSELNQQNQQTSLSAVVEKFVQSLTNLQQDAFAAGINAQRNLVFSFKPSFSAWMEPKAYYAGKILAYTAEGADICRQTLVYKNSNNMSIA